MTQTLLPPEEAIEHAPTLDLLAALIEAGWLAVRIGVAEAELRHPRAVFPIHVSMAFDDTSRLSAVLVGGRQVPFRVAIEYAQAQR